MDVKYLIFWFAAFAALMIGYLLIKRKTPEFRYGWLIWLLKLFLIYLFAALAMFILPHRVPILVLIQIILLGDVISDAALFLAVHIFKKDAARLHGVLKKGYAAAVISTALLVYGFVNMQTVTAAPYTVHSDKLTQSYKIVFMADVHYGSVQRTSAVEESVKKINALHPDAVILGGDITDEFTSAKKMREVYKQLEKLKSTYGTYYVYGNHDVQDSGRIRNSYRAGALEKAIRGSGITIVKDSSAELNSDLVLLGRNDYSRGGRKNVGSILKERDADKFCLLAEHEPVEMNRLAAAGTDLVLCGHRHAGQIFPLRSLYSLLKIYPAGEYRIGGMTEITSAGFGGWGFPYRTESHSEYLVVELEN